MSPKILITRPHETAKVFADQLRKRLGNTAHIVLSPLFSIEYSMNAPRLDDVQTLIFTSAHAVKAFARFTQSRSFTCYTVGPATAKAARDHGFETRPGPGTAFDLADKIVADAPKSPCLYLRGDHVAYDLEPVLNTAGLPTRSAIVYHQVTVPLTDTAKSLLDSSEHVVLPIFSPRTARLLFANIDNKRPVYIAAISNAVAQNIPSEKVSYIDVADTPDVDAMLRLTEALWHRVNRLEGKGAAQ